MDVKDTRADGVGVVVGLEDFQELEVGLRGLDGDDIGVKGDDVGEDGVEVGVTEVRVFNY